MNELDLFESLRPSVRPMSAEQRSALRGQLFGGDVRVATSVLERADALEDLELAPVVADGPAWDVDAEIIPLPAPSARRRRVLGVAAAVIAIVGLGGIWVTGSQRDQPTPPAHASPTSDAPTTLAPVPAEPPAWYSTIRPLLPEGMDQIVLTDASPEVLSFKAFRNGTRQMLDVTVTLQPGYDSKPINETPTGSDEAGTYYESTSAVVLTTPDDRRILVRCGLSPIGGGAVGDVALTTPGRDYCGDGFDNLGIDAPSRRTLAVRLATELPTDAVTPAFGQPVVPPARNEVVAAAASTEAVAAITEFVGDDRPLLSAGQYDGVLAASNLSVDPDGPVTTELTIIHGVWPPRAADTSPANSLAPVNPPGSRFSWYEDKAVAFVVTDDGTGYHILTSETDPSRLDQLGSLLETLIELSTPAATESDTPLDNLATGPADTLAAPTDAVAPTPLELAMVPGERILLVDASGDAELGGDLRDALTRSGLNVIDLVASNGEVTEETVAYIVDNQSGAALNDLVTALPLGRAEQLTDQALPVVDRAQLPPADIVVVVGSDLADAEWRTATDSLVAPSTGRVLIVDATGTERGRQQVNELAGTMRQDGVDVADDIVAATRIVEQSMFVPIGHSTRWTFAVAELLGTGGFDTWTPGLIDGSLPDDVTAVLVIGGVS